MQNQLEKYCHIFLAVEIKYEFSKQLLQTRINNDRNKPAIPVCSAMGGQSR